MGRIQYTLVNKYVFSVTRKRVMEWKLPMCLSELHGATTIKDQPYETAGLAVTNVSLAHTWALQHLKDKLLFQYRALWLLALLCLRSELGRWYGGGVFRKRNGRENWKEI